MKTDRAKAKLDKKLLTRMQGYDIFTIDAFGVRDLTKADEEFTNFAIHGDFPDLIPKREIWIDDRLVENEGIFYLANALTRLSEQAKRVPDDRAYSIGLNIERALRERLVGVKFRAGRPHKRVPSRIYNRPYVTLLDVKRPIEVWLIDGNLARSVYKTDYTQGGHGYVYAWVPKGEIWVEHDLEPAELPYIVAHEYLELRLMRDETLEYGPAHAICSAVEYELREGGDAKPLLAPGGRKFSERDLPGLTSPEFFAHVVKRHVNRPRAAAKRG